MVNLIPAETVQLLVDFLGFPGTLVLLAVLVIVVVAIFVRIFFSPALNGAHYEETEEEFFFGGEATLSQSLSREIRASHKETHHEPKSD